MSSAPPATDGELDRLAALLRYDVIGTEVAERAELEGLCELAARLCDTPTAVINLIDDRFQHQIATHGCEPAICSRVDSMCYTTLLSGEDVALSDASQDDRFRTNPWVDGRLGTVGFYTSLILRTPDGIAIGTLCVFDMGPRPVQHADKRALRIVARQVIEVLELRARSRALKRALDELGRSHDQLAMFAGQVSHDLKSPLTSIIGFAELLQEIPSVTADHSATVYAQRCHASGVRMLDTIDRLLAYARVGGRLEIQYVPLAEVMSQVVADLSAGIDGAKVEWAGADLPGDAAHVRTLLQNLVANSLNYRRPGLASKIFVEAISTPAGVEIRVIDNGTSIPADQRTQAVQPLKRLRKDVPGSGLGLATCVRIAAAHGGSLELDETPGGGTTVIVRLPAPGADAA